MKKLYSLIAFVFIILINNLSAQCTSDAGTMTTTLLADCLLESIDVPAPIDTILDNTDTIYYAIHDSPSNILGNVIAIVPNLTIELQAGMEHGVTYYVSALVGNATDTGLIDLDDPCLSIAAGTPIMFEVIPIIEVENMGTFCQGEEITVNCIVPDDYTFNIITNTGPISADSCPFVIDEAGIYQIFLVSPNNCGFNETFIVEESDFFVEIFDYEPVIDCNNEEAFLATSTFNAANGPIEYAWSTGQVSSFGAIYVSTPGVYSVTVTDANGCSAETSIEVSGNYEDCATISGKLVKDENDNCIYDEAETPISGKMIRAVNAEYETYAITDDEGNFYLGTPIGTYDVEVLNPLTEIWENCPSQEITLDIEDEAVIANFALSPIIDCPLLSVDFSTWALRPCIESSYSVIYCNNGTLAAEDAYIEITFDELIEVLGSTLDFTLLEPNLYLFDLGNISIGECGSFSVTIQADCDADLGLTACSQAVIYPHDPCSPDPSWNGASVEVTGDCTGDEVVFNIENVGTGNMEMPSGYIVIEDGVMLSTEPIDFELDAGEILPLSFAANGSTYIVQVMQVAGHPGFSAPTSAVEACGVNAEGEVSTGFVLQYPLDEDDSWQSEDCHVVTGSYDPNDKAGSPRGYGDNHYIDKGQDLEYLIRFQNTGTDTAFTVRIDDVLAPELDITTLRAGASSHPYELNIRGADTLEFLFENILLPDSFVNEVASHGFVQFKVSQKEGLEYGTIIENTAGIYFDFNEAIITNTTFHELGQNYVETTSAQNILRENLQVEIFPNPIHDEFVLSLSGADFQEGRIDFFDITGKQIYLKTFNEKQVLLQRNGLSEGIYFYKIHLDGEFVASGKVIFML